MQRVWVGDTRAQANLPDARLALEPTLPLSTKLLPEKVPVICENLPTDGNEPEYLVGISVAASATAGNRAATVANTRATRIILFSGLINSGHVGEPSRTGPESAKSSTSPIYKLACEGAQWPTSRSRLSAITRMTTL